VEEVIEEKAEEYTYSSGKAYHEGKT